MFLCYFVGTFGENGVCFYCTTEIIKWEWVQLLFCMWLNFTWISSTWNNLYVLSKCFSLMVFNIPKNLLRTLKWLYSCDVTLSFQAQSFPFGMLWAWYSGISKRLSSHVWFLRFFLYRGKSNCIDACGISELAIAAIHFVISVLG